MSQFQQLRVVHPIAVNRTVVHTYNFRLKGAPEQMFRNTISFANIVNGTGSLVLTDDLEIYNRIGMGLSSAGAEWIEIGRGYQSDVPDAHGGRRGQNSTSEVYIRNMLDAWLGYMTNGHAEPCARGVVTPAWQESRNGLQGQRHAPRRPIASRGRTARLPARQSLDLDRCEQFLLHEARLLDDGKFDDWLALFTRRRLVLGAERARSGRSGRHRVADLRRPPAAGDARAAARQPAHVFAGAALAHQPHGRQRHASRKPAKGFATVRSKFLMIEYRREQQRLFGGTALHRLVQADGRIMIAWKRVDLVNCDAPLDGHYTQFRFRSTSPSAGAARCGCAARSAISSGPPCRA